MPAVNREIKITYGVFVMGGTTDYLIDGKIRLERKYTQTTLSFEVIVTGATESAFVTACNNLENAILEPNNLVKIELGSTTFRTWDPSANTGFNAQGHIAKMGDEVDTGRSRRYAVSIDFMTPADESDKSGRKESTVEVTYTASRRRNLTVSGVYTALSSNSAMAQYQASIGAYVTAIQSLLTGTWELVDEQFAYDDENKVLNFSRIYEELIYNQSAGTLDNTTIVQLLAHYAPNKSAPGDTVLRGLAGAFRLITMVVSFEASVDHTVTKDLVNVWETILRGYLITQAISIGRMGVTALIDQSPNFDYKENKIVGSITLVGTSGGNLLESHQTIEIEEGSGLVHLPVWDGNRFSRHEYQGPANKTRIITTVTRRVGSLALGVGGGVAFGPAFGAQVRYPQENPANAGGGGAEEDAVSTTMDKALGTSGDGWRPVTRMKAITPTRMGMDGYLMPILQETQVEVDTWVKISSRGGGVLQPISPLTTRTR